MENQGSLLVRGLEDNEGYQRENHPVMSFQAEAWVEQFRVYLEVGFGGADQGPVSGTFLDGREMLADGVVGASYSGE